MTITASQFTHGIVAIDSGLLRDRMACCYLLEAEDTVAVIECGTAFSVPRILQVLAMRGWDLHQVSHVLLTHVHLDHAGGAGQLMQALPQAELWVHPRGVRHMADPTRLEQSARRVYGDDLFDRTYGTLMPVTESRIQLMEEGGDTAIGDRRLVFADTPGHARHHACIWDEQSQTWFTGDTFGLSYRELDHHGRTFIFPTTTPIQFDPAALHESIDRLMERNPVAMNLTHYGQVGDCSRLAQELHRGVDDLVAMTETAAPHSNREARLAEAFTDWLKQALDRHGCRLNTIRFEQLLGPDVMLNTQGLLFWYDQTH